MVYDLSIRNEGEVTVKSVILRINVPPHGAVFNYWNLTRVDKDETYSLPSSVSIAPGSDYNLSGYILGGTNEEASVRIVATIC